MSCEYGILFEPKNINKAQTTSTIENNRGCLRTWSLNHGAIVDSLGNVGVPFFILGKNCLIFNKGGLHG